MLLGYAPGSFSVGDQVFLDFRSFAYELCGLVARPPYLSTDRFVSRRTVADFSVGTTYFGTRVAQQLENSLDALAKSSQVHFSSSCRQSWKKGREKKERGKKERGKQKERGTKGRGTKEEKGGKSEKR